MNWLSKNCGHSHSHWHSLWTKTKYNTHTYNLTIILSEIDCEKGSWLQYIWVWCRNLLRGKKSFSEFGSSVAMAESFSTKFRQFVNQNKDCEKGLPTHLMYIQTQCPHQYNTEDFQWGIPFDFSWGTFTAYMLRSSYGDFITLMVRRAWCLIATVTEVYSQLLLSAKCSASECWHCLRYQNKIDKN